MLLFETIYTTIWAKHTNNIDSSPPQTTENNKNGANQVKYKNNNVYQNEQPQKIRMEK